MIDYIYNAISYIAEQLKLQSKNDKYNHIWLLYGDEGMGKSSIANKFANTQKGAISYKCSNEFDLAYHITGTILNDSYNRYLNLYYPLIKKVKEEGIHKIIFDIEGNINADYFNLIFDFYESINQQNYPLDIILFVDSNIYRHNQNIFAHYPQLIYLKPLRKWEITDFIQLWDELYGDSLSNKEMIEMISAYSMGNAGVFLQHLNILKFYNIMVFEKGNWKLKKGANIDDFLKENFSVVVKKKYELLEPSLQIVIQQTSTIGYIFQKRDLSEAFNIENATYLLKQIELISELLYFTDSSLENGKFDSKQAHKLIEEKIDSKHHKEWCLALAEYYESKIKLCCPLSIETYHYKEKCILYYEKANETLKIISHYISLIPLLYNLNLYNTALEASRKLKCLTKGRTDYVAIYQYSFYLMTQINRKLSNYNEALECLKNYINLIDSPSSCNELDYLTAELFYGTGENLKAYGLLRKLYKNRKFIDDPVLKLNIVSLLSSVEETLNKTHYVKHYNEALYLCTTNNMIKEYHTLLRKANMAHDGENSILLMKKGEEYFKKSNDIIELIMVKHNIGTESLFYENTFNMAKAYLEYAYETASKYGFNQLSYIINSLAILDILEGQYSIARDKLNNLLKLQHEDFTLMALYINMSTCFLKLNMIKEAILMLNKAKSLNIKKENKIPFYAIQIILVEAYIYLTQKEYLKAYQKLCEYFNYGLLDRSTGILSAKIVLFSLCEKFDFKYPDTLSAFSGDGDSIAIKMSNNHLVLCDLMFWE